MVISTTFSGLRCRLVPTACLKIPRPLFLVLPSGWRPLVVTSVPIMLRFMRPEVPPAPLIAFPSIIVVVLPRWRRFFAFTFFVGTGAPPACPNTPVVLVSASL